MGRTLAIFGRVSGGQVKTLAGKQTLEPAYLFLVWKASFAVVGHVARKLGLDTVSVRRLCGTNQRHMSRLG